MVVDELRIANWMRSKDGAAKPPRNRPKRVSPLAQTDATSYGKTDRSPAEVMALLERYAPGRHLKAVS